MSPLASPTPALETRDWAKVESSFWEHGYVVIDNLLTEPSINHVMRFITESSGFTKMDHPYIGAYMPRLDASVVRGISEGLEEMLPALLKWSPLQMFWIYKHLKPLKGAREKRGEEPHAWKNVYAGRGSVGSLEPQRGSTTHNDMATINVNLMLSREDAKISGGGLTIYLCDPLKTNPKGWDHEVQLGLGLGT